MFEQAEVLEDNADPTAKLSALLSRNAADILIEQVDLAAGRVQRHEQEAKQRRFAGAGGSCKKVEGARTQVKIDLGQHFRAGVISQCYV